MTEESTLEPRFTFYLQPGYLYFTRAAATIRTVVGSCVAVCLWDKELNYGAMNHFLSPEIHKPDHATPRYGNVATAALVNVMREAGCDDKNLVAQIIGGASPANAPPSDLGVKNVEAARSVLARKGILIVSEDVGGKMGRKVVFDTHTGRSITLKVHELRDEDWTM